MSFQLNTKLNAAGLRRFALSALALFGDIIAPAAPWLLLVLFLMLSTGCSQTVSVMPTPQLQANLAAKCPPILFPVSPLVDPARAEWELDLITKYGDCATRHMLTVQAWPKK